MIKGEKGMGETLKRGAQECKNDAIQTQMNKINPFACIASEDVQTLKPHSI